MNGRLIYLSLCCLVFAAIVHIGIIFLIPVVGEKDAARRIIQSSSENRFEALGQNSKISMSNGDPFFRIAACKFDLTQQGLAVSGAKTDVFWSASIFNARGRVLYSLNERTAIGNQLKMLLVNPIQMAGIRQLQPEGLETSIVVETSETSGFVIVRALLQDSNWEPTVNDFFNNLKCLPYSVLG